jgi:hypothetical protein
MGKAFVARPSTRKKAHISVTVASMGPDAIAGSTLMALKKTGLYRRLKRRLRYSWQVLHRRRDRETAYRPATRMRSRAKYREPVHPGQPKYGMQGFIAAQRVKKFLEPIAVIAFEQFAQNNPGSCRRRSDYRTLLVCGRRFCRNRYMLAGTRRVDL